MSPMTMPAIASPDSGSPRRMPHTTGTLAETTDVAGAETPIGATLNA